MNTIARRAGPPFGRPAAVRDYSDRQDRPDRRDYRTHQLKRSKTIPLPSGYVMVMPFIPDRDTSPRMEGLLVPGTAREELRNRIILADRAAPAWFHDLVGRLSNQGDKADIQLRVNVVDISNNGTTAYVRPYFESEEELLKDWEEEKQRRDRLPKTLEDCLTMESMVEFVYRYVAQREEMHFIRINLFDDSAIAVGRHGVILLLTGAHDLWRHRQEIFEGKITFDEATRSHIRWARAFNLSNFNA